MLAKQKVFYFAKRLMPSSFPHFMLQSSPAKTYQSIITNRQISYHPTNVTRANNYEAEFTSNCMISKKSKHFRVRNIVLNIYKLMSDELLPKYQSKSTVIHESRDLRREKKKKINK